MVDGDHVIHQHHKSIKLQLICRHVIITTYSTGMQQYQKPERICYIITLVGSDTIKKEL